MRILSELQWKSCESLWVRRKDISLFYSNEEELCLLSIPELVDRWDYIEIQLMDLQLRIEEAVGLFLASNEPDRKETLMDLTQQRYSILKKVQEIIWLIKKKARETTAFH